MYVYRDNKCTVWCQCGNCTHNYSRGTEDAEDLRVVCPEGAQRRSERKTLSWQQGDGRADQFRSCSLWCSGDLRWKLDLLLWPRDQGTEFPVEACWISQTQESRTEQIHQQIFDDPFFWQHWQDLHSLGSHWTDSQQGILCWAFKGGQEEIASEEASTLQIRSVAFPTGQYTSPQLHRCHWLFDQEGIETVPIGDSSYSSFWLFPKLKEKLRGCRHETLEEMKEAVMKVIDTLTQENLHGDFQKLLERYNKCIVAGGNYFEGD